MRDTYKKLEVLHFPDPRLRKIAKEVDTFDDSLQTLIDDMFFTMYEEKGIGLAATQVDIHKRIIVIDITNDKSEKIYLINPKLISLSSTKDSMDEGCLSVPGFYETVSRPNQVKIETYNTKGEKKVLDAEGLLAVCIQHEIDHLNGKLFVDHISNLKKTRIEKKILKLKKEGKIIKRTGKPYSNSVI